MITTNTGAKKLESSDNWREIFPNPGTGTAGAHNASVDAQDRIQAEVAPIINGKQCALGAASGDYVLLRNSTITGKSDGAYIATKAIPANTDLDSTYLGNAITGGISNSLNNNITTINNKIVNLFHSILLTKTSDNYGCISVTAADFPEQIIPTIITSYVSSGAGDTFLARGRFNEFLVLDNNGDKKTGVSVSFVLYYI